MLQRDCNVPTGEDSHERARERYGLFAVSNGIFTANDQAQEYGRRYFLLDCVFQARH
jgi:hypothetical protein